LKLVDTELQTELLNFLQKKKDGTWTAEDGSYEYFLEQFRPKRTKKEKISVDNSVEV